MYIGPLDFDEAEAFTKHIHRSFDALGHLIGWGLEIGVPAALGLDADDWISSFLSCARVTYSDTKQGIGVFDGKDGA